MIGIRLAVVCLSSLSLAALAETLTVIDGQDVVIPVSSSGVTIQLPGYVRIVTPAHEYQIHPILSPLPSQAVSVQQGAETKPATDVRAFSVRSLRGNHERVTFMLADDRNVTVRFVGATEGSDNFFDLRWTSRASTRSKLDQGFLASERAMMLAMLRDESVMSRKVLSTKIKLDRYPQLDIKLLRTFQAEGLTGYTFSFVNHTKDTLRVNPTVLSVGAPSRVILTQMDHETLSSCDIDNSPNPRGSGCMSSVRLVVRGSSGTMPGLTTDSRSQLPFMIAVKEEGK